MTAEPNNVDGSVLARWITRLSHLFTRRLWLWPLFAAAVLAIVGSWTYRQINNATRAELASRLQTVLLADVAALRLWFAEQEADARAFAVDSHVRAAIADLSKLAASGASREELVNAGAADTLKEYLLPSLLAQHYLDYVVLSPDRRILASPLSQNVNRRAPATYDLFFNRALQGELAISRPFVRELLGEERAEGPTMFVAAPVLGDSSNVLAVIALRMKPEKEFSQIFSVARMGDTGESYAFDERGLMLTASRFDGQLRRLKLIPPGGSSTAILNLRLLDPEVDLTAGEPWKKPRRDQKLTRMAAQATAGHSGSDLSGYRNYRGVEVIGAWAWLPQYGMGVATEVAAEEAFHTLGVLRQAFLVLLGLLGLSAVAIFGYALMIRRLEASVRNSTLAARRLGQYVLVEEIGRGANGMVYRARHSLLRRPVAIKLLDPSITDNSTAARFEQEAQMTSQLTHPNTVAIFDYGRTPEGLFYYAMEYLSGVDLDRLVRVFGPVPEARVIHILRQVCGSLSEAHKIGLIHRDIKPANIVLTRRGGLSDLVKVLDFGLVKTARPGVRDKAIVGTPHFMAPESIQSPEAFDPRSDLYSLAAVGYWLLTGKTLFESTAVEQLLAYQIERTPPSISERLGRAIDPMLEKLLMSCLSKEPASRPASTDALEEGLGQCAAAGGWTAREAEQWWNEHGPKVGALPVVPMPEKTLVIAPRE